MLPLRFMHSRRSSTSPNQPLRPLSLTLTLVACSCPGTTSTPAAAGAAAAGAKPQLVQMSCARAETRGDFLSKGVTMRYSYFDKDKRHIATIDVTPADCGL